MSTETVRVLIAHGRHDTDDVLAQLRRDVEMLLAAYGPVSVTLARDEHAANFTRAGGWDAWVRDVATGIDPVTREPRYSAYVVNSVRVGKATAEMLRQALAVGKTVIRFVASKEKGMAGAASGTFEGVRDIVTVNERDFKSGWAVRT